MKKEELATKIIDAVMDGDDDRDDLITDLIDDWIMEAEKEWFYVICKKTPDEDFMVSEIYKAEPVYSDLHSHIVNMYETKFMGHRPIWQPEPDEYKISSAKDYLDKLSKKEFDEFFEIDQQRIGKELAKKRFDL